MDRGHVSERGLNVRSDFRPRPKLRVGVEGGGGTDQHAPPRRVEVRRVEVAAVQEKLALVVFQLGFEHSVGVLMVKHASEPQSAGPRVFSMWYTMTLSIASFFATPRVAAITGMDAGPLPEVGNAFFVLGLFTSGVKVRQKRVRNIRRKSTVLHCRFLYLIKFTLVLSFGNRSGRQQLRGEIQPVQVCFYSEQGLPFGFELIEVVGNNERFLGEM